MADQIPLKLVDVGGGKGRLQRFEAGDTIPVSRVPGAVPLAGGVTMAGPLEVPAGASGNQVPQAQEIPALVRAMAVGTVSQSGGVPTGAVIERGLNANGSYVRFADGTQICWRNVSAGTTSSAYGPLFMSPSSATGNWAAAFVSDPIATAVTYESTNAQCWCGDMTATTSGFTKLRIFSAINTATANVQIIAIGRWF